MTAIVPLLRDRLRTLCMPPLRLVDGAAEVAGLAGPPPPARLPAAYVLPIGTTADPNSLAASGFRQRITERVDVLVMAGNVRDPRGEAAADDLSLLVEAVRGAVAGWQPHPEWDAFELVSGELADLSEGVVTWRESYAAVTWLRR